MLDQKLFKFIVLNLLSNAVKYSPRGGTIKYKIHFDTSEINIEISDEGIGIPEKDQANLFEAFNRGSNIGEIHGTGLGMSIIKRSVDIQGGSISFQSKEGKGTRFVVILPLRN